MKKTLFLLIIIALSYAQAVEDVVRETENNSTLEIIKDWRIITILSLLVTGTLIALAFMFGHAFEMPDLKAWASVEFIQAIVTVIIVITVFAVISFLDSVLMLS